MRQEQWIRCKGDACWEEEEGGGGQPTCQAAQERGRARVLGKGWEHVHTEIWGVYEMQTVGSTWSIPDMGADASRVSEAGGDGCTPSTRSQGNPGCQWCSERDGAGDAVNLCGLGPEQWQLFTQGNTVQHIRGLCGGHFHRQQTQVY